MLAAHGTVPHISFRRTRIADVETLVGLSRRVYPRSPYEADTLSSQIHHFPEGHFVAEVNGDVVAMSACLRLAQDDPPITAAWATATSNGSMVNHDRSGDVLYSVDTLVSPHFQRAGIARRLLQCRIALGQRLGISTLRSGARLIGYRAVSGEMPAHEYVNQVVAGKRSSPSIELCLKLGFYFRCLVPRYWEEDTDSGGFAAMLDLPVGRGAGEHRR